MDWNQKSVLITGGTGSFGQKFVATMLQKHKPRRLIVFSRDELKQSEMAQEFRDPCVRFFLGDVRDRARLTRAFDGVDIVVHAAALKQVPSGEYNPSEVIQTNIIGSQNVIEASIDRNVERVIALSTDKAASPINLYGATKLCADKLFVAGNSYAGKHQVRFAVVRYGNVINSRGSVIPLFRRLKAEGRLPITDPRMTRFWITLEQGVEFVIRSLDLMHGGEIFVPKLASMKLLDLAEAIAPGCKHDIVGIRSGEKLHEVLVPEDDARRTIEFDDYYVIQPDFPWWGEEKSAGGRPVADRFCYSSDTNPLVVTPQDLRKMLGEK
ncbi:MAG: UDP-N-acetylglucosamine 4,6-dehydratase (inverting) [Planctomycetes bacterium]|nr:UDP-N-acetylglucosamine 4,6-dehydratase (inverting) [Planctomycetota bacterium]